MNIVQIKNCDHINHQLSDFFITSLFTIFFATNMRPSLEAPNDIIDEMIGTGRWQYILTFLLSFCILIYMLNAETETIMRPEGWWCRKPDFLHNWTNIQWITYSHHVDDCTGICTRRKWNQQLFDDSYFQGCTVYNIDYSQLANISWEERPPITTTETASCLYGIHYSFEGQNVAKKFNLGCTDGKLLPSIWQSSSIIGRVVGYLVMGTLSDWIGRKTILFISCICLPITAIPIVISRSYILFIISNVLNSFFNGGLAVLFILIMEVSGNIHRSGFLAVGCCCFALGIGLTPMINHFIRSYDITVLIINLFFLIILLFHRILPESQAWLFVTYKINNIQDILKKAAKINQSYLNPYLKLMYVDSSEKNNQLPKKRIFIWNIIFKPELSYEIIGITYLTALYGLIFGSSYYSILEALSKSYLANSLIALAILIGMLCGQICLFLMGHKKILQISIYLVFLSSILLSIDLHEMEPLNTGPTITLLLANISLVSLSYGVLLNYNVRTIPTLLRGTFSGIWRAVWAIFVWLGNHNHIKFPTPAIPLILTCLVAGLFCLNFKDVHGRELPDTILDSVNFKIKTKPRRWTDTEVEETIQKNKRHSKIINWILLHILRKKNIIDPEMAINERE